MNDSNEEYPRDTAKAAPYIMDFRTRSFSTFWGTWPKLYSCAVNENLMDDDDDSFYEIAEEYLRKCSR